jgi:hypothetical protein
MFNPDKGRTPDPERYDKEPPIRTTPSDYKKDFGVTALNSLPRIDSSSIRYGKEIPFPKNERTYPDNKNDLEANHPL